MILAIDRRLDQFGERDLVSRRDPGLRTRATRLNTVGKNIHPITIHLERPRIAHRQDSVGEIQAQPLRHSLYQHSQSTSPSVQDKRISTVTAPKPNGTCLGCSACFRTSCKPRHVFSSVCVLQQVLLVGFNDIHAKLRPTNEQTC